MSKSTVGPTDTARAEELYRRGRELWREGNRAGAMSCYAEAVSLDADSPAAVALEQARSIEAFFNPDLLNP